MTVITYLGHVRFDFGALGSLPEDLAALEVRRPLVVTDAGIAAAGLLDRLRAVLPDAPVFARTPSNPTEAAVHDALAEYRGQHCDGLVAFGGGSPIDLAKGVALLATHAGDLEPYAAILGGVARIGPVAPLVAIPTTAGTGSEVGRAALITLEDGRKLGFISPHLIPKRAICDPDLLVGMPARLTAATGMDALSHCIETFLSPRVNPPAEAIALDGAARLVPAIRRAVADPGDRAARWETMMGALEGGLTFQKGLGAVHGLSHALGGLASPSLHHGLLNAVLLAPVLRHNRAAAPEKMARLAAAMGAFGDLAGMGAFGDLAGMGASGDLAGMGASGDLAGFVERFNAEIGLPPSLAGMGIDPSVVRAMAERAMIDHSTATNPRPMTAADYEAILRSVL